jgi:hypothetical protein
VWWCTPQQASQVYTVIRSIHTHTLYVAHVIKITEILEKKKRNSRKYEGKNTTRKCRTEKIRAAIKSIRKYITKKGK